jgi:hypothetical protein
MRAFAVGVRDGGIDAPAGQYSAQLDRGFERHTAMGAERVRQSEYGVGKRLLDMLEKTAGAQ